MLDFATTSAYNLGMAKRRPKTISDQVRHAIDESGVTRYRIAQETGIDQSALAKFYNGHRGLTLENFDRLCEYLGLRIVADRKATKKGE